MTNYVYQGHLWFNFEPTGNYSPEEVIALLNDSKAAIHLGSMAVFLVGDGEPIPVADILDGSFTLASEDVERN